MPSSTPPGPHRQWLADPECGAPGLPFQFLLNLVRDFGDAVCYPTPYGPVYFFNHPEDVRQVLHSANIVRAPLVSLALGQGLIASDGPYWRGQRRLMQPDLHENCLQGFEPLILDSIGKMLAGWKLVEHRSVSLDIAHEMKLLTLDIVARAMFSTDLSEHAGALCEAIDVMVEDLGFINCTLLNAPLSISPSRNARFQGALATVDRVVFGLIEERRASHNQTRDLLSTLVDWRDPQTGEGLSNVQLRDEIVTILIAGHETTAIALAWAWHLLAENLPVLRALQREVDEVLNGRLPSIADLPRLPWNESVLNEAMRLYPPVWMMVRRAEKPEEIGGYSIPQDAFVLVSAYTTQRHPQFWENPEVFDPERFTPNTSPKRPLYAHFPFGGGRHLCLGMRFALIEGQLILAALAQKFDFHSLPNSRVVPQPVLTLRQQFGVPMQLEVRQ